jgi:hypothetical protein
VLEVVAVRVDRRLAPITDGFGEAPMPLLFDPHSEPLCSCCIHAFIPFAGYGSRSPIGSQRIRLEAPSDREDGRTHVYSDEARVKVQDESLIDEMRTALKGDRDRAEVRRRGSPAVALGASAGKSPSPTETESRRGRLGLLGRLRRRVTVR